MVTPLVVTEILPVVAPAGTVVVSLVGVAERVIAVVLLNFITLLAGFEPKFTPLIVTGALIAPLDGVKSVIAGDGKTLKLEALVRVMPLTVTVIGPVVAPTGTVVVIVVDVEFETIAVVPLNFTTLFASVVLKFVPVIVTVAPGAPVDGLNPDKVGVANTMKLFAL